MELDDIRRVRDDWVRAAKLVRDAFDIVYVYGGHSYLPVPLAVLQQAHRRYGGSLENRARFWLETLEACARRSATTAPSPSASAEALAGRRRAGRGLGFVRLADHLVDLWDVNVGSIIEWSKDSGVALLRGGLPARGPAACARRPRSRSSASAADEPRPHGRDRPERRLGPDRRRAAVDRRPVPPKKIEEGRYGEIRECIGCNICV